MKTDPEISLKALKLALPVLEALEDFSEENVKAVLMELAQKNEMKTGQIMWPSASPFPACSPPPAAPPRSPTCWARTRPCAA